MTCVQRLYRRGPRFVAASDPDRCEATVRRATITTRALDYRETVPAAVHRDLFPDVRGDVEERQPRFE